MKGEVKINLINLKLIVEQLIENKQQLFVDKEFLNIYKSFVASLETNYNNDERLSLIIKELPHFRRNTYLFEIIISIIISLLGSVLLGGMIFSGALIAPLIVFSFYFIIIYRNKRKRNIGKLYILRSCLNKIEYYLRSKQIM